MTSRKAFSPKIDVGAQGFFRYGRGLIAASSMPKFGRPSSKQEIREALRKSGAWLLRWQDAAEGETEWWTMVCRDTSLSHLKKKSRWTAKKNIKKGLEAFTVEKVSASFVSEECFSVHVDSYGRYQNATPQTLESFQKSILMYDDESIDYWICRSRSTQKIIGWCAFWRDDIGVFLHTIDITPPALHDRAGYAFLAHCLAHYVDNLGLPVSNGSRSVAHATDMQDFVRKLGFQREYGYLRVEYVWWLSLIVAAAMPFRSLIDKLNISHLLSSLLRQEYFARSCKGPSMFSSVAKRLFDIVVSFTGLVFLSPIIFLTWVMACCDTRSNGLFSQKRVGKDGVLFNVLKLKTMRESKRITTTVTTSSDSRITRLGAFFRSLKLDELPQLWNVLRGEMSLVGPRPDVIGWADTLKGEDSVILQLRPGITGPATLFFRNEETLLDEVEDAEKYNKEVIWPKKVALNRAYFYHQTFFKDIKYILKTLKPSRDES